ncbi:MAG: GTPase Era [Desulfobacterales bacterium]|jgi:GTPase|nr:GTPase Era [Desulfobacteraceae bacterium]MBT4365065.1 GTPase Era [Desulfobacteraceae bacterium]MBT7085885.1 GTPase Era [Desulfobacterales bacterium]MBT7697833.1 GTPase Era [Desulfobacterales bacterium]
MGKKTDKFKSGFVAITGAPNAGKSTLLNRVLGEKISITSKKPQTTRNRILGITHREKSQIMFIDTPGVHMAKAQFNIKMVEEALTAIGDVDAILILVDVSKSDPVSEKFMVSKIIDQKKPVLLGLNKIDIIRKNEILELIDKWSKVYPFEAIIPISAKHGTQVDDLLTAMENLLPEGPPLFPEEMLTDMPMRFIVAEMIREKVFRLTGQEVPYSTAVIVDDYKEKKKGSLVSINATIHVERDSQKGIIIGKGGSKLKKIGEDARMDIERMIGAKVFLKLFVRVQKNWSSDTKALRNLGY